MSETEVERAEVQSRRDDLLPRFLAGRDVPCPICAYNLRDLKTDRCPECGEGIVLSVRPLAARLAAWIAALTALAAGFGFCFFILCWWALEDQIARPPLEDIVALILGAVLGGGGMLMLLWQRRRFRRLPGVAQWMLAVCGAAVSIGSATAFFAMVG